VVEIPLFKIIYIYFFTKWYYNEIEFDSLLKKDLIIYNSNTQQTQKQIFSKQKNITEGWCEDD